MKYEKFVFQVGWAFWWSMRNCFSDRMSVLMKYEKFVFQVGWAFWWSMRTLFFRSDERSGQVRASVRYASVRHADPADAPRRQRSGPAGDEQGAHPKERQGALLHQPALQSERDGGLQDTGSDQSAATLLSTSENIHWKCMARSIDVTYTKSPSSIRGYRINRIRVRRNPVNSLLVAREGQILRSF